MTTLQRRVRRLKAYWHARHAPPLPPVDSLTFFRESTGHAPDAYQEAVLRSDAERTLLVCGRQVGKSTTAACLATYTSQYEPKSLTLIVAPSLRQSAEVFRKAMDLYDSRAVRVPWRRRSALRAEFMNGARIISLPASARTLRGYTPDLLIVDEAGHCEVDLWRTISPSLAVSRGKVLLSSTPAGRNWFCELWEQEDDWLKIHQSSLACPRIDPRFLQREKKVMPLWMFQSEYEGLFVEIAGRLVFRPELVRQSVAAGIPSFTFSWEQPA